MSLTKILSEKDVDAEVKLKNAADVVAVARENYGNQEAEIPAPMVETPHGRMGFVHLEADSKVAILKGEVQRIKAQAVECAEQNKGVNLNKKIEELVATNAFLANIDSGTKFEYI